MPESAYGTEAATRKPVATADVWNLGAAPETIEEVAGAWRGLALTAVAARETVTCVAGEVLATEAWEGDAADAYDDHRRKVSTDLAALARYAESVADALDGAVSVLRNGQELLGQQLLALTSAVPSRREGAQIVFEPADATQASAVRQAIAAANEIRSWVDEELAMKEGSFLSRQGDLDELSEMWTPRTVRVMNLNIGQGHGNGLGDTAGTDIGDLPRIAEIIDGSDANIVTVQEVFRGDLDALERNLEERTGDEWNIHFGEASTKVQVSTNDGDGIWGSRVRLNEEFGNAVLVREGDGIETSEMVENIKLDEPGGEVRTAPVPAGPPTGTTTTTVPGELPDAFPDGEGRSATHVEVRFED